MKKREVIYARPTKKSSPITKHDNNNGRKISNMRFTIDAGEDCIFNPQFVSGTCLNNRYTLRGHLWSDVLGNAYHARDAIRGEDVILSVAFLSPDDDEPAHNPYRRVLETFRRVSERDQLLSLHDLHEFSYGGASLAALSMEYPDGGSFEEWLDVNRTDLDRRQTQGLMYFQDLCRAVKSLHNSGVVHGNLMPASGWLVRGRVKIVDWWEDVIPEANMLDCSTSESINEYRSPRRFLPRTIHLPDARDDIYSLGAILYRILHPEGKPPFAGAHEELERLHTQMPVPPLPVVNERLQHVLNRCLDKDPMRRFERVEDLLESLLIESPENTEEAGTNEVDTAKADNIWQIALQALAENDFTRALCLCEEILKIEPSHEDAPHLANDLRSRYAAAEKFYEMIARDIGARDLDSTIALIKEAISIFPNHPEGYRVQMEAELRAQTFKSHMVAGAQAMEAKNWDLAVQHFTNAQKLSPGTVETIQAIDSAQKIQEHFSDTRRTIDEAITSGDWHKAQTLARKLDEYANSIANRCRTAS